MIVVSSRFEAEELLRMAASGAFPDEGNVLVRGQDGWLFRSIEDITGVGTHTHVALDITDGVFLVDRIPDLPASKITSGILPTARGGTGRSNPLTGNLLVGAGSSPLTLLAPGAVGGYVRSDGITWVRVSGVAAADVNAGTFSGAFTFSGTVTFSASAAIILSNALGIVEFTGTTGQVKFVDNSGAAYEWAAAGTPALYMRVVTTNAAEEIQFHQPVEVQSTLNVTGATTVVALTATGLITSAAITSSGTHTITASAALVLSNTVAIIDFTGTTGQIKFVDNSGAAYEWTATGTPSLYMRVITTDGAEKIQFKQPTEVESTLLVTGNTTVADVIFTDITITRVGVQRLGITSSHLRLSDSFNLEWGGGTNFIRGSNAAGTVTLIAVTSFGVTAPAASYSGTLDVAGTLTLTASAAIVLSNALAKIDFTGTTGQILFMDNSGAAFEWAEGANLYMRVITTNLAEEIEFRKPVEIQSTLDVTGSTNVVALTATGLITSVAITSSGTHTISASAALVLSNALGIIEFTGTTGQVKFLDNSGAAYEWVSSGVPALYMRVITTDGAEKIQFKQPMEVESTLLVTGVATFTEAANAIIMSSIAPKIKWIETDRALDEKRWDEVVQTSRIRFRILSDSEAVQATWMEVNRTTTTVDSVAFPGTAVSVAGTLDVTGTLTVIASAAIVLSNTLAKIQFTNTTGQIVFNDNSGAAYEWISSGTPALYMRVITTNAAEKIQFHQPTEIQSTFLVTGTATFSASAALVLSNALAKIQFTNTTGQIVFNDNSGAAYEWTSSGTPSLYMRVITTTAAEKIQFKEAVEIEKTLTLTPSAAIILSNVLAVIEFTNTTGQIKFNDNAGAAFEWAEGANVYMRVITTNAAEKIQFKKPTEVESTLLVTGTLTNSASAAIVLSNVLAIIEFTNTTGQMKFSDNVGAAYEWVAAGTPSLYMRIVTTAGSEEIGFREKVEIQKTLTLTASAALILSNTLAIVQFSGTTGQIKFSDNSGAAYEWVEGSNLYLRVITTNGSEEIEFHRRVQINALLHVTTRMGVGTAAISNSAIIALISSTSWTILARNTHATVPSGILVDYSAATPNNSTSYFFRADDSTNTKFRVQSTGNVENVNNSYGMISDRRLKTDIVDVGSQWDDFKDMRFRNFRMILDVEAYGVNAPVLMGCVAQEIQKTSPGLISVDENGMLSVKYSILYMKGMCLLQELQHRSENHENRITRLESELPQLEAA